MSASNHVGWVLAGALVLGSCSLGNIKRTDCESHEQCASLFGAGSQCEQGYCSAPLEAGSSAGSCDAKPLDGGACAPCKPSAPTDFANACTNATCAPFDDRARLTRLSADGGLPPLPPVP